MGEIFTIPPEAPFAHALATGLLDQAEDGDFGSSDTIVLLPTRRACQSLRDAFLEAGGGRTLILPRIQPLGDVDPDELLGHPAVEIDLPPAISRTRRLLLLARLLGAHDRLMPLKHRLRLADDLALLLDELASERKTLEALHDLVPDHLAEHFQVTRRLLDLIDLSWPSILAEEGALDPAERRNRVLDGLAARLVHENPEQRIIVAGTTGSIDATRRLLRAVLERPHGEIVLPGLDLALDEMTWRDLPPNHPQAGLKQLLQALGRPRATVRVWPAAAGWRAGGSDPCARNALLREAMRPAQALLGGERPDLDPEVIEAGRAGLELMVCRDQAAEATALALRMRAVLEEPGKTAILVTPDRALARRVGVELRRWGIDADDSAGTPLDLTAQGSLLLLAARLLDARGPVDLLALLKHPLVRLGRAEGEIRREACRLERKALRGPRISGGLPGILTELHRLEKATRERHPERAGEHERSIRLIEAVQSAARPLLDLAVRPEVDLARLVRAHVAFVEALAAPGDGASRLWAGEAGEAALKLVHDLIEATRGGHPIAPLAYPALLGHLMAACPVRRRAPRHPRLRIYGQLEARLQQAGLVLIAGLNEGVWPASVDAGPWLNRTMRDAVGLPPLERRIGLAAHDLQQLAATPAVVLSRAERDASGSPTVPSRWLVRLQTLLDRANHHEPAPWPAWAALLDQPVEVIQPTAQPRPGPPLHARPRTLSVSDVGLWMRDPYALYARRVLKLKVLAPLEQEPGALERGIMIHEILESFVRTFPERLPTDALARLMDLGRRSFEAFAHRPLVQALWWPRFEQAARWYVRQEAERRDAIETIHVEAVGSMSLERPGGRFTLNARADRIERGRDGCLTIIDYKTGNVPDMAEVTSGRQPQLPLEALMVRSGGFERVPPQPIAALWFWSITGSNAGGRTVRVTGDIDQQIADAHAGLIALIDHYDGPSVAYPARLRPETTAVRDYDHLARFKEWAG